MVQFTTYTLLGKLLFYLCTRSIFYLFFLASLHTQDGVLRTSRQSFWHQDHTPHPHGTGQGQNALLSTGPGYYKQFSTKQALYGSMGCVMCKCTAPLGYKWDFFLCCSHRQLKSCRSNVIFYLIKRTEQQISMTLIPSEMQTLKGHMK